MSRKQDLVGLAFGRLTVVKCLGPQPRNTNPVRTDILWECVCICGTFRQIPTIALTKGNTKSCGCYSREISRKNCLTIPRRKFAFGESEFNNIYSVYKRIAKQRGYKFDLSKEQAKTLFKGNCKYCNSPPSNVSKHKNTNGEFVYNGIDRLDNKDYYHITNVVSCCALCNWMKRELTVAEFLEHTTKIHRWKNKESKDND